MRSSKDELLNILSLNLGKGEAETIALASELKAEFVLLDDLRARKVARRLKVKTMGTLGVLKVLIDVNLVREDPLDLCEKLIAQGFWIDMELCKKILGA